MSRMLMPSTRQPTIRARCSALNLFAILTIMLDRSRTVNSSGGGCRLTCEIRPPMSHY
jgi:hypothetical protein